MTMRIASAIIFRSLTLLERFPYTQMPSGRLAQLGERLPYKQEVGGSIPSPPIPEPLETTSSLPAGLAAI